MTDAHRVGLEDLSAISQVDISRIRALFDYLSPPENLIGLLRVLRNLLRALEAGRPLIGGLFLDINDAPSYSEEDIHRLIYALSTEAENRNWPPEWLDDSNSPRNIIGSNPVWAMLVVGSFTPGSGRNAFWQHFYLVLQCAIMQRNRPVEKGTEITEACRVIRQLAEGSIHQSTLRIIHPGSSLKELQAEFESLKNKDDGPWVGVELLVRRIIEGTGKSRNVGGFIRSGSVIKEVWRQDEDDSSPEGPVSETHLYQASNDEKSQNQARASGLHPEELEDVRAVSVSYNPKQPTATFDVRDHLRRQSSQVTHLRSLNQRLPYRFPQLTGIEMAAVAAMPSELIKRMTSKEGEATRNDDYIALLLGLLFWLGRPLEALLQIRVYEDLSQVPVTGNAELAYIYASDTFILPVKSSKWRKQLSKNDRVLLEDLGGARREPASSRIFVASPFRFKRLIEQLVSNKGETWKNRSKRLFPSKLQGALTDRIKIVLREKNAASKKNPQQNALRLTALRISQVLFDEITRLSSDWVDSALITGQQYTTTEVSAHYYNISGEYLQGLYHRATSALTKKVSSYLGVQPEKYFELAQSIANNDMHGSKLNIQPALVKMLVQHLKHQLGMAKRRSTNPADIHNAFVTYIACWILFSTGYRAVNDLIFDVDEIDWQNGFLVISDKDDDDQSNSRIVQLTPHLFRQLECLLIHLDALQASLRIGSDAWERIRAFRFQSTVEDKSANRRKGLMFFMGNDDTAVKLTPESLRAQVGDFSLPMNSGRHYLRTRLRQIGCDAEYVNAYLGHWQVGQQPFGRFSTLSPFELAAELAPHLEFLRQEAGWSVQAGLVDA